MKNNNYPLVYIEWEDAYSVPQEWNTAEDMTGILADESFIVRQVGFVLKETKTFIVLANMVNTLNLSDNQYSGLHRIPKGCLRKRIKLKVSS